MARESLLAYPVFSPRELPDGKLGIQNSEKWQGKFFLHKETTNPLGQALIIASERQNGDISVVHSYDVWAEGLDTTYIPATEQMVHSLRSFRSQAELDELLDFTNIYIGHGGPDIESEILEQVTGKRIDVQKENLAVYGTPNPSRGLAEYEILRRLVNRPDIFTVTACRTTELMEAILTEKEPTEVALMHRPEGNNNNPVHHPVTCTLPVTVMQEMPELQFLQDVTEMNSHHHQGFKISDVSQEQQEEFAKKGLYSAFIAPDGIIEMWVRINEGMVTGIFYQGHVERDTTASGKALTNWILEQRDIFLKQKHKNLP